MPKFAEVVEGVREEINELRRSPQEYAGKLETFLGQYRGLVRYRPGAVPIVTKEGPQAVVEAISVLRNHEVSLGPCEWSVGLASAAQKHAQDLSDKEMTGHIGSDGRNVGDRVAPLGHWEGSLFELLDFGSFSRAEIICCLLVDDGMPLREHRDILLTPSLRRIGIGMCPHPSQRTVTAILLASKFTDKEDCERVGPPDGEVGGNPALRDWVEGAVRMSCEVTTETEAGVTRKRIIRRWEMADGSVRIIEELTTN